MCKSIDIYSTVVSRNKWRQRGSRSLFIVVVSLGCKLWRWLWVGGGGGGASKTWPKWRPANEQSYHSCSSPSNGNASTLTLKTEQGANLQRQQRGRGPLHGGRGYACCEQHSDLHTRKMNQPSAPQSSREEMKGPILFLREQRDHMALEAGGTWPGPWACWV